MDKIDKAQQDQIDALVHLAKRNIWHDRLQWAAIGFLLAVVVASHVAFAIWGNQ